MEETDKKSKYDKSMLAEIYRVQWADVHHSRNQDWELIKVILAGILGLSGISTFSNSNQLVDDLSIGFIFICILGAFVTIHHKSLFKEKLKALKILEHEMGVDELNLFPQSTKKFSEYFTTQNFLIFFYIFSALIFGIFLFLH